VWPVNSPTAALSLNVLIAKSSLALLSREYVLPKDDQMLWPKYVGVALIYELVQYDGNKFTCTDFQVHCGSIK
jgi:hypothetical protein